MTRMTFMAASSPGAPRSKLGAERRVGDRRRRRPRAAQGTAEVRLRGDEAAALQMNLTLRVWRQRGPREKGRMTTYRVQDVSPDVFVLGDAGRAERAAHGGGRRPDRLRQRLPGGHLWHLRPGHQRHRPRTQGAHHDLPAAHAQLQRTNDVIESSRGGPSRFRSSRTWSSTVARRCSWAPRSPWACCPRAGPNATPARWP